MFSTRRYFAEELETRLLSLPRPYCMQVGNQFIPLRSSRETHLACSVVAAYHNEYCSHHVVEDDGFDEHTRECEERIEALLNEPDETDDDSVTSAEDMVYEGLFYM